MISKGRCTNLEKKTMFIYIKLYTKYVFKSRSKFVMKTSHLCHVTLIFIFHDNCQQKFGYTYISLLLSILTYCLLLPSRPQSQALAFFSSFFPNRMGPHFFHPLCHTLKIISIDPGMVVYAFIPSSLEAEANKSL